MLLLQAGGAASGQSVSADVITDPETYAVYAAVLETGWPRPNIPRAMVALEEKNAVRPACAALDASLAPEWRQAVDSYARENNRVRWLVADADLGVPYVLVTSPKYEDLLMEAAGDVRKIFDEFWGQMSVSLSAVGFDSTKTHAVVALQYSCQTGCGGGKRFLLEKEGSRWRPTSANVAACEW